jgi:pimeloyl-ACP methyl ester carboxylesterase
MSMTKIEEKIAETWDTRIKLKFKVRGSGPPLVYLHPESGLFWDKFLIRLSERYTIYAPEFPGTNPADSFAIHALDDVFDLVLAYEGALQSLGLVGAPVIGPSFGGMLAAELASCFTGLFSKVVLLDPQGLWNEQHPWTLDFMSAPPHVLAGLLFADPEAEGPKAMFAPASSPEQALERVVEGIWTFGCAAKFLWPVPDRGLSKRLHRMIAPTLILWGEDDKLIPVSYARAFSKRIRNSRVETLRNCGHIPQVEKTAETFELVSAFLKQ